MYGCVTSYTYTWLRDYPRETRRRPCVKGVEIPVKVMIGEKAKNSALSGLLRNLASGFPVSEVVDVPGRVGTQVYDHDPKNFNEQVVRLSALAMLSNGRAGSMVRTTLKKKNELMEAKRAQEATVDEV